MKLVRILLVIGVVVGLYYSLSVGRDLQELRGINRQLSDQVGRLDVKDPSRVYFSALETELDPSGIDDGIEMLWRYRFHFPADYAVGHATFSGLISSDSPRRGGSGSSSSSSGSALSEAKVDVMTISISKSAHGWSVNQLSDNSSGTSSLRRGLDPSDRENLVIEPVVRPEDGTISFAQDEPICLLRIRSKEPDTSRRSQSADDFDTLYNGFYYYLVPKEVREEFDAQVLGRSDR